MKRNLLLMMSAALLMTACIRQPTEAEKHMEEDYEVYHKKLMVEKAEAEYRKTPAYRDQLIKQQAADAEAWKREAGKILAKRAQEMKQ